jgi:hypothetical protein
LQCCKQIWTHCFSVVTYHAISYYRFLNTDCGLDWVPSHGKSQPGVNVMTTIFVECGLLWVEESLKSNVMIISVHKLVHFEKKSSILYLQKYEQNHNICTQNWSNTNKKDRSSVGEKQCQGFSNRILRRSWKVKKVGAADLMLEISASASLD